MTERILLVDDEANVLAALRRGMRRKYEVDTAESAEAALQILDRGGIAVVISDLRMPTMDGIQLLSIVKERWPDVVRVMLTGNADVEAASASINEGSIFRFLTKPCATLALTQAIDASLAQYRLIVAERDVLEKTLIGCVTMLTEVLGVIHPAAFSRGVRIRRVVTQLATALRRKDCWRFEAAAMLSQIGCIMVPAGTLEKVFAGLNLTNGERRMYSAHPATARNLLRKIPRLGDVAQMIGYQQRPYRQFKAEYSARDHDVRMGAQMLHVAIDFDDLISHGLPYERALEQMRARPGEYDPELLDVLAALYNSEADLRDCLVPLAQLSPSMVLNEDVRARNGLLLMSTGELITDASLERLMAFSREIGIVEPINVRTPPDFGLACLPAETN